MNNGTDIQQELREMGSILTGLPRTMPYSVPAGYFDRFDETVKDHCIPKWGKALPYTVPAGYFDQLPGQITAWTTAEYISVPLADMPFQVPQGYFGQLPQQVLAAARAQETHAQTTKRKRIPMPARWAAAAILVLGIGISTYRMLSTTPVQETPAEHILASVQAPELEEYLDGNYRLDAEVIEKNDDINKMKLDEQDIIKYLDETGWDM